MGTVAQPLKNKPFFNGAHAKAGFASEVTAP